MIKEVIYDDKSLKVQVNYIIDENLNKLKGKKLAPKLEEANALLRKLKSPLPK